MRHKQDTDSEDSNNPYLVEEKLADHTENAGGCGEKWQTGQVVEEFDAMAIREAIRGAFRCEPLGYEGLHVEVIVQKAKVSA